MRHPIEPAEDIMPGTGEKFIYCKRCGQPENQHVSE